MRKRWMIFILVSCVPAVCVAMVYGFWGRLESPERWNDVERPARIRPDYAGTVIPPNIAPLNFVVVEDGVCYCVKIYSEQGKPIEVRSRTHKIVIPERAWHKLLRANRGRQLYFDVFVKSEDGQWNRYAPIGNTIAAEPIDNYLVYRKVYAGHNILMNKAICQRSLESYDEVAVLNDRSIRGSCFNCHSFCSNQAENMLIHVRSSWGPSMVLIRDGVPSCVDSRTQFNSKGMGHSTWHPSGKLIVFTIYNVQLFYHSARRELRDAFDNDSAMGYYVCETGEMTSCEQLSDRSYLETWPTWSPDGRYLYFCRAPVLWKGQGQTGQDYYNRIKYDLVRVSYDVESDGWGEIETVVSSKETGLSVLLPRVSPDGRWLVFCMCNYGAWAGFQESSDLYILDLESGPVPARRAYRPLGVNSDQTDYWKSWSGNSRWLVFSSKRGDGIFTKPYFSYIDRDGRAYKPFVLPQRDPAFYDSFIRVYQLPELVSEPVPITGGRLARLIGSRRRAGGTIATTGATVKAGAGLGGPEDRPGRE